MDEKNKQVRPIIIGICDGSSREELLKQIDENIKDFPLITISLSDYKKNSEDGKDVDCNISPNFIDFELLLFHLEKLRNCESCEISIYDIKTKKSTKKFITADCCSVIIIEGLFCFCDYRVRNLMDLKIFIDTDSDIRLSKSILQGIDKNKELKDILSYFQEILKPAYDKFVLPTKKHVDLILPNASGHENAVNIITFHLKKQLNILKSGKQTNIFSFTNQLIEPKYQYSQNKILVPRDKQIIEFIKSTFEDFITNRLDEEFIEAIREKLIEIISSLLVQHLRQNQKFDTKIELCLFDGDDLSKYDFNKYKSVLFFKPIILNEDDVKKPQYILSKNQECNLFICSVFLSPKFAHFLTNSKIYEVLFSTVYYSEFFNKYDHIIKSNKTILDEKELEKLFALQYLDNFVIK